MDCAESVKFKNNKIEELQAKNSKLQDTVRNLAIAEAFSHAGNSYTNKGLEECIYPIMHRVVNVYAAGGLHLEFVERETEFIFISGELKGKTFILSEKLTICHECFDWTKYEKILPDEPITRGIPAR